MQTWIVFGVLTVGLIGAYWNTLTRIAEKWENPQYSHGYLVPLFAVILLWLRRQPLGPVANSERWIGVGIVALSVAMRLATAYYALVIPEMLTFLPALIGIMMLTGGWSLTHWAWPSVAFLVFMYPLPDFIERGMLDPMQGMATAMSTFALQTLGFSAFSEGNRIMMGDLQMGVVDACSGLRMLTIFFALATAITLVTDRPWWERAIIIASAIPIALAVNVIRITVTGVLHRLVNAEVANAIFHDFAGWVMMPMALGFLYVELQVLSHLFVTEDDGSDMLAMGGGYPATPR